MRFHPSALLGLLSVQSMLSPSSFLASAQECPLDIVGREMSVESGSAPLTTVPSCQGCRSFEANPSTSCDTGDGWDLMYTMGPERGDILFRVCLDDDKVTVSTTGGTAGSTPFTSQEKHFFNTLAAKVELDANQDEIDTDGSLEALIMCVSRTLAHWFMLMPANGEWSSMSGQLGNWPCTLADMLTPPDCRGDLFNPAGLAEPVPSPTEAAPTEAAPTKAAPTQAAPTKAAPTQVFKNSGAGGFQPPAPTPAPTGCNEICHVTSNGASLNIISSTPKCLGPEATSQHLENHVCDFVVTPNCDCDGPNQNGQWTMDEFRACVEASTISRPDCPLGDPIDRLNGDGLYVAPPPTPSPTTCTDICKVYVESGQNKPVTIEPGCIPDGQLASWTADHPCDYYPDESNGCGCTGINNMNKFRECTRGRGMTACPPDPTEYLTPEGTIDPSTPFVPCTDVCVPKRKGGSLTVETQCAPDDEIPSPWMDEANFPCSYVKSDDCPCSAGALGLTGIKGCAGSTCPDDWTSRIQEDGKLTPTGPSPISAQCDVMCRVTYQEKPNGGYSFAWSQDDDGPPCMKKKNVCDWPRDQNSDCDCESGFSLPMIKRCADETCPFAETKTVCDISFPSKGVVSAVEIIKPGVEGDALLASDPCNFEVTDASIAAGCHCLDDNTGQFDSFQVAECTNPGCPQRSMVDLCDLSFEDDGQGGTIVSVNELRMTQFAADQHLANDDPENCDFVADNSNCRCIHGGSFDNAQVAVCAPSCSQLPRRELWVTDGEGDGEEEAKEEKKGWFGLW